MLSKDLAAHQMSSSMDSLLALDSIIQSALGPEIPEDLYSKILIALTEAVNNAILHGNQNDARKKIYLNIRESGDYYEFTITDEGSGFDYRHLPNPTDPENITKINGRGVFIMKNLSDYLDFQDNGKTVILKFCKQTSPAFS
ncbi:MAG: ATP-binding protein [Flavobacteriales bacterium]|nr:ATP-binding protein [Flavobacteriales bacterium]MCX7650071.1 ATP-binding protein [Flavobacteriales bacterium]MDW8432713.1 ATP-binding protein [Flavobacteriales bacterium]